MPELVARTVATLAPRIPADVMLGYHLCFGTLGGWPMHRPKDLSSCVALARVVLAHSGREVDYIHIPVLIMRRSPSLLHSKNSASLIPRSIWA
jgi:hypothetical protein